MDGSMDGWVAEAAEGEEEKQKTNQQNGEKPKQIYDQQQ